MTHATAEEIHDHAYGFRLSEHVAGCADCGRAAEAVTAERETLRDVLEEDSASAPPELIQRLALVEPKHRRIGSVALAAAALLLAALAWALLHPGSGVDSSRTAQAPPPTQEAEIERLIAEYKNPSPRRQAIAAQALLAYGGAAIEPLTRAGAPASFIDQCRGLTVADLKVIDRLKEKRVKVDLVDVGLIDVVDFFRESSGRNIHISGIDNPELRKVTLKLADASIYECLEHLRKLAGIPFTVRDEVILVGQEQPPPVARAPLRLSPLIGPAKALAARLEGGNTKEVTAAVKGLQDLGFAAEPVLWEMMASPKAEVQAHAADLLRRLYPQAAGGKRGGAQPLDPNAPAEIRILETWIGDVDVINGSTADILADLAGRSGLSILIDPDVDFGDKGVTFRSKGLILKNNLKLLLSQFSLDYSVGDGWVMVSKPGRIDRLTASGPLWLPPEEAKTAQALMLAAVSPDEAKREGARRKVMETGRPALSWLAAAAAIAPEADAAVYRALHRDLAESLKIWIVDRLSGIDLQTLTPEQKAILERPMAAGQKGIEGLPLVVKSAQELRFHGAATPGLKLGSFLKAIARIQGLDLYMSGNEVVIDTAANVRKVVEK